MEIYTNIHSWFSLQPAADEGFHLTFEMCAATR